MSAQTRPEGGTPDVRGLGWAPNGGRSAGSGSVLHEDHTRYSKYLFDPLFTHHAVLEDELRLNSFFDSREGDASEWRTSLEVAYAFSDALGAEMFIPVTRVETGGVAEAGVGDIEIQPIKWSFVRRHELILTGVLGAVVPTGDSERGLGEGKWILEPHLFLDAVVSTLALQTNLVYGFVEGGEQEFEFSAALGRMFYVEETTSLGPMLEFMGRLATRGDDAGGWEQLGIAPGGKIQIAGWHFGVGLRLPLIDDDPSRALVLVSGGYHVSF